MDNAYVSYFAPVNFDEGEENKSLLGLFSNSADFVSMSTIIDNLSTATVNSIEDALKDAHQTDELNKAEADYIKSKHSAIKNKLTMLGSAGHLQQIEAFLKPVEENLFLVKIKSIADTLNSEHFNGFSKDFFKDLLIDISGTSFFSEQFGIDLDKFRTTLKNICQEYDKAYTDLFEMDEAIKKAVDKFSNLTAQLDITMSLDVNEASLDIYKAFNKYLLIFFKEQNIKEKFDKFVLARKKFVVYRDLMTRCIKTVQNTDDPSQSPMCVICMQSDVKMAFVPCGHTFCLSCANKNIRECYVCRTKINSRLKLYFS